MPSEFKAETFTGNETAKRSFDDAVLIKCRFENYTLQGANLYGASFTSCSFKRVDFYWASMFDAKFIDCELEAVSFRGANMKDVVFTGCRLIRCDFSYDNLGADTDLSGVTFTDSEQIDCDHTKFQKT